MSLKHLKLSFAAALAAIVVAGCATTQRGPSEWDGGDGNYLPIDGSPVQFIFPGEPGFASTQPLFDCDAVMSSLSLPPKS